LIFSPSLNLAASLQAAVIPSPKWALKAASLGSGGHLPQFRIAELDSKSGDKIKARSSGMGSCKKSGFIGFCQVIHTPFGAVKAHRIFTDILLKLLSF